MTESCTELCTELCKDFCTVFSLCQMLKKNQCTVSDWIMFWSYVSHWLNWQFFKKIRHRIKVWTFRLKSDIIWYEYTTGCLGKNKLQYRAQKYIITGSSESESIWCPCWKSTELEL